MEMTVWRKSVPRYAVLWFVNICMCVLRNQILEDVLMTKSAMIQKKMKKDQPFLVENFALW